MHPNINKNGTLCCIADNLFKDRWSPALTLEKCLHILAGCITDIKVDNNYCSCNSNFDEDTYKKNPELFV